MIARFVLLLGAVGVASAAAGAPVIKVGDSWTFEARDGYAHDKDIFATYRVDVTGISDSGIDTSVTSLDDGTVRQERFTRSWNPVAAEWTARRYGAYGAYSLDHAIYPDRLMPGVRWQRTMLADEAHRKRPALQKLEVSPPYPEFPDRLEPGVKWHGESISRNLSTGRQMKMDVSGRVIGTERIRVPAGDFDAVRIQRETYLDDANSLHSRTRVTDTEWFAPELGRSVRYETRSEYYENSNRLPALTPGDWIVYELSAYKMN